MWMTCNTCKNTVLVSETGICKACQGANGNMALEDSWEFHMLRERRLKQKITEELDAVKERIQQKNNQFKYQERDGGWEATKASSCHRP